MAPLQVHELRIPVTPDDLPEDRFTEHVNNARYFAFINRTFQSWYRPMGLRERGAPFLAVMAHCAYDFLRQVHYPGEVLCRIEVVRVGRTSLEHAVQMWDVSGGQPLLAGRGKVVHVGTDRATGASCPWPAELLAKCWAPPGGD